MTSTVDSQTAENEFDRFTNAMDLDLNTDGMDAEDLTAFNKQKHRLMGLESHQRRTHP